MAPLQGPPLLRPFKPGERRNNPDGSYSTEITTTWQTPDGKWVNAPSLWMGPQGPVQFDESDEQGIMGALRNYEQLQGPYVKRFASVDEAEAAAAAKSHGGGVESGMPDLSRIKNNVRKMVDMNAPEADIDAYIAEEGVSLDEVRAFKAAPQAQQSPEMQTGLAEMSAMTQNPARAQYDALPAWQKPLVAASDVAQLTASGAMMGWGEKGAAALRAPFTDKSYDEELAAQRGLTQGARNRAGGAGVAAELTGAIAAPLKLAGKGVTLAGRGGTAAMTGVPGLVTRSAMMGGEGAGYGALTAAGNDQNIAEGGLYGLLGGAAGNVVGEGISAGVGKVASMFNKAAPKIGVDDLNAAKDAAYAASEKAGVIIKPQGIQSVLGKVKADMADFGYHPKLQQGAATVLEELERVGGQNVTLKGLDTIRKLAGNAYIPGNKSNNALVSKIVRRIDELIDSNNPQFMAGINSREGIKSLLEARKFAHRARKLETVEKLAAKGARIGGRQKNQDVAGATRRQLQTVLDNEAKGRGFTGAEKKALEKATGFTVGQRALDTVGGLMPQGKLGAMLQAATAVGTGGSSIPFQMAGMAAGYGAHKASEALAQKSVKEFVDLVARGGVPAPVVQNAMQLLAKSKRDAISRALMALSVHANSRAQQPAQ